MNPILSIIVPVYKVEAYLNACVDSILGQSFGNFELILVDDGSPDGCGAICDEYAHADNRIKVIHKTNGGLSSARNAGIAIATGTYLTFVDSDDQIAPDTYLPNMNILLNNPSVDLLEYPIHVHCNSQNGYIIRGNNHHIKGKKNIFNNWIKNRGHIHPYACNKIFRNDLFSELKFPEGKKFEDLLVIIPLLKQCKHFYTSAQGGYLYYLRSTSICNMTADYSSTCNLMEGKMLVLNELLKHDNLNKEMLKFFLYTIDTLIDINRKRKNEKIYYQELLQNLSIIHLSVVTLFKLDMPVFNKIKNIPLALFGIKVHCNIYKFIRK